MQRVNKKKLYVDKIKPFPIDLEEFNKHSVDSLYKSSCWREN